jgi:hypothetical protein
MNMTLAKCGHQVPAEGAPNSMARRACESRPCSLPRCCSGLSAKFTDEECEIYCYLHDTGCRGWLVDMVNKSVVYIDANDVQHTFRSLKQFETYLLQE